MLVCGEWVVIRVGGVMLFVHKLLLIVVVGGLCGCSNWPLSSKWAMDDIDYSEKYSKPYGEDKSIRMLKQMFDARHIEGKAGVAVGGGGGGSPATGGVSVSSFSYLNYWTEIDFGLTGLAGTGAHDWFIGPEAGVRFQTPTRIAPFAGAGGFLGGNRFSSPAENDLRDNDDDGAIDELGERRTRYKAFAAVYPEVGIHAWLNGKTRLTANARYYVTEEGRNDDFWYIGLSIGWLFGRDDDGEGTLVVEEWFDEDEADSDVSTLEPAEFSSDSATKSSKQHGLRVIDAFDLKVGSDVE